MKKSKMLRDYLKSIENSDMEWRISEQTYLNTVHPILEFAVLFGDSEYQVNTTVLTYKENKTLMDILDCDRSYVKMCIDSSRARIAERKADRKFWEDYRESTGDTSVYLFD